MLYNTPFRLKTVPLQRCLPLRATNKDEVDWFEKAEKWIRRAPLILGASGFVFVVANRLSLGVKVLEMRKQL